MPRAEVGTPKWLANKMKSKGLQRLRWYCQMCEKQCRDENGFKCHRMSEGHLRQMQVFSQRAGRYMDEFSRSFEATFMSLMRTRYCRAKILANTVYCDLIADKEHVHMNATIWSTLGEFVMYLKRSGKVAVEESEQGWVIEYIDRDRIEREKRDAEKRREEISCEQRREKILKRQIADAWAAKGDETPTEVSAAPTVSARDVVPVKFDLKQLDKEAMTRKREEVSSSTGQPVEKKMTGIERLMHEQKQQKLKSGSRANLSQTHDPRNHDILTSPNRKYSRSLSSDPPEGSGFLPLEHENGRHHPGDDSERRKSSLVRRHRYRSFDYSEDRDDRRIRRRDNNDNIRSLSRSSRDLSLSSAQSSRSWASHSLGKRQNKEQFRDNRNGDCQLHDDEEIRSGPRSGVNLDDDKDETSWIRVHLIVRVKSESLADGKYHGQKGEIKNIRNKFGAEVEMLEGRRDLLLLDQEMVEPVVPAKPGKVMVIKGPDSGKIADVLSVHIEDKVAEIDIQHEGSIFVDLAHICKFKPIVAV